nr:DUF364 domain-containing protein [Tahibacter harae]
MALDCLRHLGDAGLLAGRELEEIIFTDFYSAAVLDNGAAGWALNYAAARPWRRRERRWLHRARQDSLLRRTLFSTSVPAEAAGLRAALLAALSLPALQAPTRYGFRSETDLPSPLLDKACHAAVIGFGGLMWRLFGVPGLRSLRILDLGLQRRRGEMESVAAAMRLARPALRIELGDGRELALHDCDTVSITGSALCNGSLDSLLAATRTGQQVIVQGQSIAVHPQALFDRGVAAVLTTRKSSALLPLARADRSGAALRPWFEGGNERLCLLPA